MPKSLVDLISEKAEALVGSPNDFDSLVDLIGDARFVLIGEASHGTHEFYRIRAQISKVLIAQRGFNAVAVEADWPDAYRVNRFVRGASKDSDSVEALSGFQAFSAMDVAKCRCPRFRRLAARTQRRAGIRRSKMRILRARSLQPARFNRSGAGLPGQSRSRSGKTRATSLQLFRTFRKGHHNLRIRGRFSAWRRPARRPS